MEVSYTYTVDDVLHANRVVMRRSVRGWLPPAFAIAMTSCGLYFMYLIGLDIMNLYITLLGPIVITAAFGLRRVRIKKDFKAYPAYTEKHTVTLEDSGLSVGTRSISTSMLWNMVSRVIESKKTFVVQYSRVHYFIIPKRAFSSETELEQSRSLFKEYAARYIRDG